MLHSLPLSELRAGGAVLSNDGRIAGDPDTRRGYPTEYRDVKDR
jgi:hypothetical protein